MPRPNYQQLQAVWKITKFSPYPLQIPPLQDSVSRIIQIVGGERGGKSVIAGRGFGAPYTFFTDLIWLVGPDYEQARSEFEYVMQDLLELGAVTSKEISFPKEGRCLLTTTTGCVVETKTSEEIMKLAGRAPGLVIMCEAAQQTYDVFLKLRGRVAEKRGLLVLSGTLELGAEWYVELYNQLQLPNLFEGHSYSVPSWANLGVYPGGREDPEILHLEKILSTALFMERHAAVPRIPSNVVFPEFNPIMHVSDLYEYEPELPISLCIDPGFAGAYAVEACHVIGNKIIVFDEIYERRPARGTDGMIEKARKRNWWTPMIQEIIIDVAGKRAELTNGVSIASMWQQATKTDHFGQPLDDGSTVGLAPRGKYVSILEGIDRYRAFLETKEYGARIGFNPRCKESATEHHLYRYPRRRKVINLAEKETPVDAHNHAIKALTYLIVDKFGLRDGPGPATKVEMAFSHETPWQKTMRVTLPREFVE